MIEDYEIVYPRNLLLLFLFIILKGYYFFEDFKRLGPWKKSNLIISCLLGVGASFSYYCFHKAVQIAVEHV